MSASRKCCDMNYLFSKKRQKFKFCSNHKQDHTFHRIYCVNVYAVKTNSINIYINIYQRDLGLFRSLI